ncbi:MAG: hypothetical protein ABJB70_05195 [Candidatus Udaeobacter sp.]
MTKSLKARPTPPNVLPALNRGKQSARRYEGYCPFKDTPKNWENAPIRFLFELTKNGWKYAGLDNVNE